MSVKKASECDLTAFFVFDLLFKKNRCQIVLPLGVGITEGGSLGYHFIDSQPKKDGETGGSQF